ncbi:hypothetical protein GCM10007036_19880 [Alsobacter metallidurans]|uniref:MAPEG family protein n=1 Tax=Alsobacter metallidurans TaxID=340221 RepID=A0A917I5Y7_9HYPH|nr:MAPEG family protein [Alsobacter metallidurans]GGH17999.1 hypothetical protein GCM10007036_19880 [Alsobacter metallidurans]
MPLLYPVLAQVLLTFVVLFATGSARFKALRERRVKIGAIAVANEGWPEDVRKFSNNYANQFETPVLFYVLCGIAIFIRATDILMLVLAWLFVVTRVLHAFIHTGSNDVQTRFRVFLAGVAVLIIMWALIVLRLLIP